MSICFIEKISGTRSGGSNKAETHRGLLKLVVLLIMKVQTRKSDYEDEDTDEDEAKLGNHNMGYRSDTRRSTRYKFRNRCQVDNQTHVGHIKERE